MQLIKFTVIPKELFFDRPKVQRAVDRARRQALSKAGAFVRQRAKTSMRKRKNPAPPGKPPHAHEGSLRRLLFSAYDRERESAVVGPLAFVGSDVPHILEFGGTAKVKRTKLRRGRSPKTESENVVISARPYMAPALEHEQANFPAHWRNSIKS